MLFYTSEKSRWNNITKISLINFFAALYFYLPYMTLYYQNKGLNLFQINSLSAVITLTTLLGEIPTGILADKFGRKYSLITALLLQTLGEVYFLFAGSYQAFFLIAIIAGLGWSFRSGCEDAFLYDSLKEHNKEKEMAQANGLRLSSALLGGVIASITAGLSVSLAGLSFPLLISITAVSVAIAFTISLSLKEPGLSQNIKRETLFSIFTTGINYLGSHSRLKRITFLYMFTAPFFQFMLISYPLYFLKAGINNSFIGFAYTVGSVLAFIGNRKAYLIRKHFGTRMGLFIAVSLPAVFYILMGFIYHPVLSFLFFCLLFGSMTLQNPLFSEIQNALIDAENRATILSMMNMVLGIYIIFMELIIGIISNISISFAYLFIGIIILISSGIFFLGTDRNNNFV